jgi:methyltransferase (TIGR00027 family)
MFISETPVKYLSYLIYIPLQVAAIPLAIVGLLLAAYRQIIVSKRLGVSQTAIEIINGRWTMHVFGMREDNATVALMSVLPNTSKLGLWLVLWPLWVQAQIAGRSLLYPRIPAEGDESIADMVAARTVHFDAIITRALQRAEQFVLLGAGYDTRAYGWVVGAGTTVFELDQPIVQAHKRSMLAAAHINCEHVNFVAIDFASDDLFSKLTQAGFDTTKKTLYLWEGVSLYLSAAEVAATLAAVQQQSAPNSTLVADLYAERLVKTLGKANANEKVLEMTGETLDFGLPFDSDWQEILNDFVTAQEMQQGETHFLGSNNKAGPYAVVVEMTC